MSKTTEPTPRPAAGGRYIRDPKTGALSKATDRPAERPAAAPAAPEKPGRKGAEK